MNYYKNLKLHSVKYGFGWRYDGDMSTHPIGNILKEIDYKFEKIQNENLKLKAAMQKAMDLCTGDGYIDASNVLYNCLKELDQ